MVAARKTCTNIYGWVAEPSGGASGQASDIAIHAKEILRVRQLLTSIYQRHCAKVEESEGSGLERFGKGVLLLPGGPY
jgi:ATP-dependent Clp protease protease subunit